MSVLPVKQRRFVEEYLVDLNGAAAAKRAGYSSRTARQIANQLLDKTLLRDEIARLAAERSERTRIKADRILTELARIAFSDIGDAFDERGDLLPPAKMPETFRSALAFLAYSRVYAGKGRNRVIKRQALKIRLWCKLRALELLGKHLGLFGDRVDHRIRVDVVQRVLEGRRRAACVARAADHGSDQDV